MSLTFSGFKFLKNLESYTKKNFAIRKDVYTVMDIYMALEDMMDHLIMHGATTYL